MLQQWYVVACRRRWGRLANERAHGAAAPCETNRLSASKQLACRRAPRQQMGIKRRPEPHVITLRLNDNGKNRLHIAKLPAETLRAQTAVAPGRAACRGLGRRHTSHQPTSHGAQLRAWNSACVMLPA
jgi:hypothetical protein